jgi:hypothetical protein
MSHGSSDTLSEREARQRLRSWRLGEQCAW